MGHAMQVVSVRTSCMSRPVGNTWVGHLQDYAVSLADGRRKGSPHLPGSTENLERRHPTHFHRDLQWEG